MKINITSKFKKPLLLLIIAFTSLLSCTKNSKQENTEDKPFKNYIGYIDQEKALLNNTYTLCNDGELAYIFSSVKSKAFVGSSRQYKKTILSEYKNNNYSDSGYLNFRFLVNCEGNAGWFEIIELNLDLEEQKLNPDLVKDLLNFTSESKHWNILNYTKTGEAYNYYNYVSYRLENGKITEIIP